MTETVLVTGGTGFIGGWAIVELLKRGYAVRTTMRSLNKQQQVRAKIATEVDPGEASGFFQGRPHKRRGMGRSRCGLRPCAPYRGAGRRRCAARS